MGLPVVAESIDSYLAEVSRFPVLSPVDELKVARRFYRDKGVEDAHTLVTGNLRYVVKIAFEYRSYGCRIADLIQEGNIGLMQAVRKFDPYKGVRFSYYASFWIKAYILKFIMDNWRLVKIGTTQAQRKLFFRLKKEKQKLISEGFDPKPKLLSERLGVTEREVTDMDQRLDGWEISLDAPIKEGSDNERSGFVASEAVSAETQVAKKEMGAILHRKLASFKKNLNQREVDILENRVFSDTPVTLQKIGKRYGISRERVRQVEHNMIKRMKSYFEREIPDFDSFLEGLSED